MNEPRATTAKDKRAGALVLGSLLLGAVIRAWLVMQPPTPAMMWDHHEYVCWSAQAVRDGVVTLYQDLPPKLDTWHPKAQRVAATQREERRICNYPPLATYIFAIEGRALHAVTDEFISNTRTARVIFAFPAMLADVLLAWGAWAIVRSRASHMAGAVAWAVTFCAPPILIDSAMWGQTDSWVLAPAVWMVRLMMRRRWMWAGALWGVALGLKTQAILLTPIWLFALLIDKDRKRMVAGMILAGAVLLVVAAPFTATSGMAWFERAYAENLFEAYKLTTLKAFNVWYVDLLLCENDDASVPFCGVEKDTWGKLLLATGVLLSGYFITHNRAEGLTARKASDERFDPRLGDRLLRFAAAMLLCAVILPTRVHERYILLPLPFLICAAMRGRRLWWGMVPLIVAASFQITSLNWMKGGAESWGYIVQRAHTDYESMRRHLPAERFAEIPPPDELLAAQRPRFVAERRATGDPPKEWALTVVELLSAAVCLVAVGGNVRPRSDRDVRNCGA